MAVDPRAFREAIRTVDVNYPIPFLVAVVLAFGLALLAFALAFGGALGICLVVAHAALQETPFRFLSETKVLKRDIEGGDESDG